MKNYDTKTRKNLYILEKYAEIAAIEGEKEIFHDRRKKLISCYLFTLNCVEIFLDCSAWLLPVVIPQWADLATCALPIARRILSHIIQKNKNTRDYHQGQADIHRKKAMRMRAFSKNRWRPRR